MIRYSVVIPVYNRPQELDELLESLTLQTFKNFEVIVVEDGSTDKAEEVASSYSDRLTIRYYYKENSGQGFSRNFGFEKARGDYFIVFDSDCLIPSDYFQIVEDFLRETPLDAFGGPDGSHESFTPLQKAISYAMTSPITTGGIRGNKQHMGPFHPRSFNMGISREVFEKTKGYIITRMGEDIEFSIRIHESGFRVGLIPDAVVFHKRRTSYRAFYKQLHFFGRARINIGRFYPGEIRLVHFFPAVFTLGVLFLPLLYWLIPGLFLLAWRLYAVFFLSFFLHAWFTTRNLWVAVLALPAGFIQLFAYGIGFLTEGWKKLTKG